MVSDKVQPALNDQLNAEFYAAYLYLGMSAYFQTRDLNGFAHWMRIQAREELEHAMRIYDFINERDGKIELRSIEAPPTEWESPLAAFENAYEHEKEVTGQINKLVDLAVSEHDHATNASMQWFVIEQVEEEAITRKIVHKLKLVGDDGNALFLMDRDLGEENEVASRAQ